MKIADLLQVVTPGQQTLLAVHILLLPGQHVQSQVHRHPGSLGLAEQVAESFFILERVGVPAGEQGDFRVPKAATIVEDRKNNPPDPAAKRSERFEKLRVTRLGAQPLPVRRARVQSRVAQRQPNRLWGTSSGGGSRRWCATGKGVGRRGRGGRQPNGQPDSGENAQDHRLNSHQSHQFSLFLSLLVTVSKRPSAAGSRCRSAVSVKRRAAVPFG